MTEQRLRELYRQSVATGREPIDHETDQQTLAAVLLGGGTNEQHDAGLQRLASLPAGPALARVVAATAGDAAELARELTARRAPALRRQRWPGWVALAAGVGAVAILALGVRHGPVMTDPAVDTRILVASFESDATAPDEGERGDDRPIFSGGFDS